MHISAIARYLLITSSLLITAVLACGGGESATSTPVPTPTALPGPPTALGPELIEDGGFESGALDNWELRQNETQVIEIAYDVALTGSRSLYMSTLADEEDWPWIILTKLYPLEVGKQYLYRFHSLQFAEGHAQVLIDFYDANDEFVIRTSNASAVTSTEEWLDLWAVVETPENTAWGRVIVQLRIRDEAATGPNETLELWVDDLSVRQVLE